MCLTNLSLNIAGCALFTLLCVDVILLPVLSEAIDVILPANADVVIVVIFGTGVLCTVDCKADGFNTSLLPIMNIVDCVSPPLLPLSSLADESSRA